MTRSKQYPGSYRISGETVYGVATKKGNQWHAEIHSQSDGRLLRFAGIWGSLKDAEEEVRDTMTRDYLEK